MRSDAGSSRTPSSTAASPPTRCSGPVGCCAVAPTGSPPDSAPGSADADGVYHPGLFNDRMLLGLKGTMSEAELHVLRARLDGGIRNKAQRGELRRALPVGLVWGEDEVQILLHPDEAVTGVIAAVFARFAASGSD